MKRFILLFSGTTDRFSTMTPDQSSAILAVWKQWQQGLGDSLVDPGLPFGDGAEVVLSTAAPAEGEAPAAPEEPLPLHGYSVVQTADLESAMTLAKSHPFLTTGQPEEFGINVYELMTDDVLAAGPSSKPQVAEPEEPLSPLTYDPLSPEEAAALGVSPNPAAPNLTQDTPAPATPQQVIQPQTIPAPQPIPQPTTSASDPGELNISHESPDEPIDPNAQNPPQSGPGPNLPAPL